MKLKFYLLTFLLLFARGCDFYSTSLWFFDKPTDETNLLVSIFGLGWTGLLISNSIIIILILYAFHYYSFKYKTKITATISLKLTDYISELYFDEKGKFYKIYYAIPKNKKVLLAHTGYVLIRVIIIGSFLATIHNLCQFYNVPIYNTYREIVRRPLFVIYGLISISFIYFLIKIWRKEFEIAKN